MSGAEERKLLEWAAKAAGIKREGEAGSWLAGKGNPALLLAGTEKVWNPRRDDGDCARMEAALGLDVRWFGNSVAIHWTKTPGNMGWDAVEKESFLRTASVEQRASAKRLAAVRAAAAIGRAMP